MQTPYYLIDEAELRSNIRAFQEAFEKYWPCASIAYSVKTNSLPWVLSYMREHGILAEVVSPEEYQLAQMCGYRAEEIVYNGPIKTRDSLIYAMNEGSMVNLDSRSDVQTLCTAQVAPNVVGLRVNVDLGALCPEDIDYLEDGFRFGFSYETGALEQVIFAVRQRFGDIPMGLHLHCNSRTRAVKVYRSIAAVAANIIQQYRLDIRYIDIGGGYFGGVPGKPTADDYIKAVKEELQGVVDCTKVRLIVEPGSALIGSPVKLVTSVLDVKDTKKARIVTTDGSRIHIDPLWKKSRYLYRLTSGGGQYPGKQIICGYTCMDHDRLMILENDRELSVGDRIEYLKVGAYSMTFGGPFIRYYPEVYVCRDGNIQKVRSRMDVEQYYKTQVSFKEAVEI